MLSAHGPSREPCSYSVNPCIQRIAHVMHIHYSFLRPQSVIITHSCTSIFVLKCENRSRRAKNIFRYPHSQAIFACVARSNARQTALHNCNHDNVIWHALFMTWFVWPATVVYTTLWRVLVYATRVKHKACQINLKWCCSAIYSRNICYGKSFRMCEITLLWLSCVYNLWCFAWQRLYIQLDLNCTHNQNYFHFPSWQEYQKSTSLVSPTSNGRNRNVR